MTPERAGVIGSPVAHSLSPAIFTAAFAAAGLGWRYEPFEVPAGGITAFLRAAGAELRGFSVTMPHKADILPFLGDLDPVAADLGAVNCVLRRDDGVLHGYNTDGAGFVDALRRTTDIAGRRCIVFGAGGAGRAVALGLCTALAAEITVVNRSRARAVQAAELLRGSGRVGTERDVVAADIVVNATSVGMGDDPRSPFDTSLLREGQVVIDIVYHPLETALLREAKARGAQTVDGLGMLVHQAAHAFEHWTGQPAPVDAMRAGALGALRAREAGA